MSKHRITRQEMKHDDFVSGVGRATRWAEDHWRIVAGAIGGLIVLSLVLLGVAQWRESRRLEAEAALDAVTAAFQGSLGDEPAPPGGESFATREERAQAVVERADKVIGAYGSTPAGIRARYYRALAIYDGGDLDGASSALEEFIAAEPNHFLAPFARWKVAQIEEQQGHLAEACEGYRSLLEVTVPEFPNELAYMDLGRCLDAKGSPDEAVETYQQMLDHYPDSTYASDARQRLAELQGGAG